MVAGKAKGQGKGQGLPGVAGAALRPAPPRAPARRAVTLPNRPPCRRSVGNSEGWVGGNSAVSIEECMLGGLPR